MEDCIFCKIVNGEIPSYCIYEDDNVKAFLDINPLSKGHTLIIPKQHFENLFDIDLKILNEIENSSKKISELLINKIGCDGITRIQNNLYGQDVKHYHMHIVPRYKNDGAHLSINSEKTCDTEEIFKILK